MRKQAGAASLAMNFENTNAQRVAQAERHQRDANKAATSARKDRDKAALQADKERKTKKKDERKKAAQKQERRR
eukprot:m.111333 g.111333  ORF g.111333 m.111333 type:complete len:74 (+) comp22773_c1_seq2:454-675(+)